MEPAPFLGYTNNNADPPPNDDRTEIVSVMQHNFASLMVVCENIESRLQNMESRISVLSRDVSCVSETLVRVQMKLGANKGYVSVVDSTPSEKGAATSRAWIKLLIHISYHIYWRSIESEMQSRPVPEETMRNIIVGAIRTPSTKLRQEVGGLMTGAVSDDVSVPIELCLSTMQGCKEMLTVLNTFISVATTNISVMLPVDYVTALNKYAYMRNSEEGVYEMHMEMSKTWSSSTYGTGCRAEVARLNPAGIKKVAGMLVSCTNHEEVKSLCTSVRKGTLANAKDVSIVSNKGKKVKSSLVVISNKGSSTSFDGMVNANRGVSALDDYKAKTARGDQR